VKGGEHKAHRLEGTGMDWPTRRQRDLLVYGGLYPLIVAVTAWVVGSDGSGIGRLLVFVAAVGFIGLLVVFSFVGGPGEVRTSWDETPPDEPAPGDVRQVAFLAVTTVLAVLLAFAL
jgi:hypothetical protein